MEEKVVVGINVDETLDQSGATSSINSTGLICCRKQLSTHLKDNELHLKAR